MKRMFDVIASALGLLVFSPVLLAVALWVKLDSKGPVFYRQVRVGRYGKDFRIFKFRTMHVDADKLGLLTVGGRDPRITNAGYYLRNYKLDELSQLLNVFTGDMSLVGPRPEVRKYVDLYTETQREVLQVRPGITDMASIEFRDENELLSAQEDPDRYYIDVIMPRKLEINREYIARRNVFTDFGVILKTFAAIVR